MFIGHKAPHEATTELPSLSLAFPDSASWDQTSHSHSNRRTSSSLSSRVGPRPHLSDARNAQSSTRSVDNSLSSTASLPSLGTLPYALVHNPQTAPTPSIISPRVPPIATRTHAISRPSLLSNSLAMRPGSRRFSSPYISTATRDVSSPSSVAPITNPSTTAPLAIPSAPRPGEVVFEDDFPAPPQGLAHMRPWQPTHSAHPATHSSTASPASIPRSTSAGAAALVLPPTYANRGRNVSTAVTNTARQPVSLPGAVPIPASLPLSRPSTSTSSALSALSPTHRATFTPRNILEPTSARALPAPANTSARSHAAAKTAVIPPADGTRRSQDPDTGARGGPSLWSTAPLLALSLPTRSTALRRTRQAMGHPNDPAWAPDERARTHAEQQQQLRRPRGGDTAHPSDTPEHASRVVRTPSGLALERTLAQRRVLPFPARPHAPSQSSIFTHKGPFLPKSLSGPATTPSEREPAAQSSSLRVHASFHTPDARFPSPPRSPSPSSSSSSPSSSRSPHRPESASGTLLPRPSTQVLAEHRARVRKLTRRYAHHARRDQGGVMRARADLLARMLSSRPQVKELTQRHIMRGEAADAEEEAQRRRAREQAVLAVQRVRRALQHMVDEAKEDDVVRTLLSARHALEEDEEEGGEDEGEREGAEESEGAREGARGSARERVSAEEWDALLQALAMSPQQQRRTRTSRGEGSSRARKRGAGAGTGMADDNAANMNTPGTGTGMRAPLSLADDDADLLVTPQRKPRPHAARFAAVLSEAGLSPSHFTAAAKRDPAARFSPDGYQFAGSALPVPGRPRPVAAEADDSNTRSGSMGPFATPFAVRSGLRRSPAPSSPSSPSASSTISTSPPASPSHVSVSRLEALARLLSARPSLTALDQQGLLDKSHFAPTPSHGHASGHAHADVPQLLSPSRRHFRWHAQLLGVLLSRRQGMRALDAIASMMEEEEEEQKQEDAREKGAGVGVGSSKAGPRSSPTSRATDATPCPLPPDTHSPPPPLALVGAAGDLDRLGVEKASRALAMLLPAPAVSPTNAAASATLPSAVSAVASPSLKRALTRSMTVTASIASAAASGAARAHAAVWGVGVCGQRGEGDGTVSTWEAWLSEEEQRAMTQGKESVNVAATDGHGDPTTVATATTATSTPTPTPPSLLSLLTHSPPAPLSLSLPVARVAAGAHHTLVLTSAGQVFAAGAGHYGQLGLGDRESRSSLFSLHFARSPLWKSAVTAVFAGPRWSACLTKADDVYIWGSAQYGVLGLGPAHMSETAERAVAAWTADQERREQWERARAENSDLMVRMRQMTLGQDHRDAAESTDMQPDASRAATNTTSSNTTTATTTAPTAAASTTVNVPAGARMRRRPSAADAVSARLAAAGVSTAEPTVDARADDLTLSTVSSLRRGSLVAALSQVEAIARRASVSHTPIFPASPIPADACTPPRPTRPASSAVSASPAAPASSIPAKAIARTPPVSAATSTASSLFSSGASSSTSTPLVTSASSSIAQRALLLSPSLTKARQNRAALAQAHATDDLLRASTGISARDQLLPARLPALSQQSVTLISFGATHAAALTARGDLYLWGCTETGATGHPLDVPLEVVGAGWAAKARSKATGHEEVGASPVRPSRHASVWSSPVAVTHNTSHMRANAHALVSSDDCPEPPASGALPPVLPVPMSLQQGQWRRCWRHVSCGHGFTAAVGVDGNLYTWGWARGGVLGHSRPGIGQFSTPTVVRTLLRVTVVAAAAGTGICAALSDEGKIYTSGRVAALEPLSDPENDRSGMGYASAGTGWLNERKCARYTDACTQALWSNGYGQPRPGVRVGVSARLTAAWARGRAEQLAAQRDAAGGEARALRTRMPVPTVPAVSVDAAHSPVRKQPQSSPLSLQTPLAHRSLTPRVAEGGFASPLTLRAANLQRLLALSAPRMPHALPHGHRGGIGALANHNDTAQSFVPVHPCPFTIAVAASGSDVFALTPSGALLIAQADEEAAPSFSPTASAYDSHPHSHSHAQSHAHGPVHGHAHMRVLRMVEMGRGACQPTEQSQGQLLSVGCEHVGVVWTSVEEEHAPFSYKHVVAREREVEREDEDDYVY